MTKGKLIKYIYESFNGVPQPNDITLHVAEAYDNYDYGNNHFHRKKDFFGRWQDVPDAHIGECQTALSYIDKIGMRYYLPAYMIWYLRHYKKTDVVKTDNVLYCLDTCQSDKILHQYFLERFSLFTKEQFHACYLFLEYFANDTSADQYFAKKQIERYWSKYRKI